MTTPTDEVSQELQRAYTYFNNSLFGGTLPNTIVLSYQRESNSFGFYRKRQYVHRSRRETGELALNPSWLPVRSLTESLATMVHAMCRLQQSLVGQHQSRPSYHNRELANYLKQVGLLPRVDGDPNGKETGHRVGHVIEEGGPFDVACRKLLAEGFAFSWVDRHAAALPHTATPEQARAPRLGDHDTTEEPLPNAPVAEVPPPPLPEPAYASLQDKLVYREPTPAGSRRKYQCPGCRTPFWGGHGIEAKCVPCDRYFADVDPASAKARPVRRKLRPVRHQANTRPRANRTR
ncbi:hypothetical protein RKE25_22870 (plasmid) [Dyella sp. BiH032]|uniref:hypothetical protein n=1 Tax=Dyella sp. BiH032 TaxID=3075430 RepID=UPI0028929AC9|nr:hypothetical protein [Dyella sp. BiH032]WNL48379.1 hypothetical protein RKE25_22870 [Dyella sp. BiH032]